MKKDNMALSKKEDELVVLKKFMTIFQQEVDSLNEIEIIHEFTIKEKFPNYNSENPDFVVKYKNEFIGIELFELVRNDLESGNLGRKEKKLNVVNAPHLYDIRNKKEYHELYKMEDLAIAATQRINAKMETKVKNYVDCPIWLVGYASKPYNMFLLSPYFKDKNELKVAKYIANHIKLDEKVTRIYLTEFSNKYLLLEIPIKTA